MKFLNFKNLSIFNKLLSLVLLTIIPVLLIFVIIVIPTVSTKYYSDKSNSLKNVVEPAYTILEYYQNQIKNGKYSEEEGRQLAIDEINTLRYSGKEYFFMYDLEGKVMALGSAPEKKGENRLNIKDHNGNEFIKEMISVAKNKGEGFVEYFYPKLGEKEASPKLSFIKYFKEWNCFIGSGVYVDDVKKNIADFKESLYLPFIIAVLLAVLIGFIIARVISKPLKEVKQLAEKAASGDLNVKIEYDASDEIGKLGKAFQIMVDNIGLQMVEIQSKNDLAEKSMMESENAKKEIEFQQNYLTENTNILLNEMEKFSQGDLSVNLDASGKELLVKNLFNGFNKAVETIRLTLSHVSESVHSTASAASQISSSAEEMAAGAQEQSSQTGEVAAAIEEMSITIAETTKHVLKTNDVAKDSRILAQNGQQIIEGTIVGMKKIEEVVKQASDIIVELGHSSEQIGQIIQVINDIADQTNLLALNAAIEAARAGEQGRGFSVVADEVRKLAERTTKATNEIEGMIKKIQYDSRNAVDAIQKGNEEVSNGMIEATKAGASMNEIVKSSDEVLAISTQVAAASEEQSTAVQEISRSVEGINTISHEAALGVQQIAGAATDLSQLAESLKDLVSQFIFDNSNQNSMDEHKSKRTFSKMAV